MLSISKDLRKLGIVSVSALMLLGVGAGISASHTPVHAMPSAQYMLTHNAAEDQAEKEEIATGKKNGVIYNKNGSVNDEATARNQDRMFHPHAIQPSQLSGSNVDVPSRDMPHTKRQANNVKKNVNSQIKHVKNAQRNLRRRISKATNRKYRTRRSKRNAKRYVNRLSNQYIHNNKKLSKLTRQLKKSERKQTRRHAVRKHRARKNAKRIKSYRHRR